MSKRKRQLPRLVGRVTQLARRGECAPRFVNPKRRAEDCAPYLFVFAAATRPGVTFRQALQPHSMTFIPS